MGVYDNRYDIISFTNDVNYNYDTEYYCEESGCNEEGICRCSTINNAVVYEVNMKSICDSIYCLYFDNSKSSNRNLIIDSVLYDITPEINIYTIDRILRHYKIWEENNWEIQIIGGYYGQEIGNVYLSNLIEIREKINEAFLINNIKDRVEYLLMLEYGNILPELENCIYEVDTININDISFGSLGHKNKVDNKNLTYYSDKEYTGIRGIVMKDFSKYRLIDGYHRCSSTENKSVKVIIAKNTNK